MFGLFFTIGAIHAALERIGLVLFGGRAVGRVVGFVTTNRTPNTEPNVIELTAPAPLLRIAFTDERGQMHEVTTNTSVSSRAFRVGDSVRLLYIVNHPQTFAISRMGMLWGEPLLMAIIGMVMLTPGLVALGSYWPALGAWAVNLMQPLKSWSVSLLIVALPLLIALVGTGTVLQRLRRLREDYRTEGVILETGLVRNGGRRYPWVRIAYRDAAGNEQERRIFQGIASRQPGETAPLLVNRQLPHDILFNEPLELWFAPVACLAVAVTIAVVAVWAWWTGQLPS